MSISSDLAKEWAEKSARSEAEAFEFAIKSTTIKKTEFDIDDTYEQAYRQGRLDQAKADEKRFIELREQINKLREALVRDNEDFYE
ncbi:hypothetical protein [Ruminococcus flavefaciens]|uniref:hypothetical protein n=1 Tax=Ruminococcus flavefaciens TaxID=1265 RepID=UPI0026EC4A32|nr:hypothetical protein [Ruminococcus flavefaciens]